MDMMDKVKKYHAGEYRCPVPSVHSKYWKVEDWIFFIDNFGVWLNQGD